MDAAEKQLARVQRLIRAAEDWAPSYDKDPENKAKLIRLDVKLERTLRNYLKDLSTRTSRFINWNEYQNQLQRIHAASSVTVDVLVDNIFNGEDHEIMRVIYDPLASALALGAQSGENIYKIRLGLTQSSELVQKAAKELVANLVGKKVTPEGLIIDNPNAKYSITNKIREDIRHSITTSLSLGENQGTAAERLVDVIKNPTRAGTIARTESVNAYQSGLMTFGKESGAAGKQWQTVGAIDVCAEYAGLDIVEFDYEYDSGLTEPAAHPNCRCGIRLVYPEEFNNQ